MRASDVMDNSRATLPLVRLNCPICIFVSRFKLGPRDLHLVGNITRTTTNMSHSLAFNAVPTLVNTSTFLNKFISVGTCPQGQHSPTTPSKGKKS